LAAQPLAADIRAPTVAKSLRLLKQEKLRLLAPILGCEYDDLRQREHDRFVRRAVGAGAAMLTLLLVLMTLSVLLFLAQQRASRNAQVALDAGVEILPLVGLPPDSPFGANDAVTREVHITNAIRYLETLRQDDPENLKCLTTLHTLYVLLADLLKARGREDKAQEALQKADSMVIPIALSRLKAWKPTEAKRTRELSGEELNFPKDYDLKRLRNLLSIRDQISGLASAKLALEYTTVAAEYLPLLDTLTGEGRAEARRVLQSSLSKFQQAQSLEPLTREQEELVQAIKTTLGRLPGGD
jgi:tetratricopeptide (TPR) repeat protein